MAQNSKSKIQSAPASKPVRRPAYTLERASMLCPTATQAHTLATRFGLEQVDFNSIRETTEECLATSIKTLTSNMNDQALEIHMQRIVGSYVASACGAGEFYSAKVTTAREMTTRLSNDSRDEDRSGVSGFESKAQRAREFAAQVGLQSYALLAAAQGAVDAFASVTGGDWKPYQRNDTNDQNVDRKAAQAELDAFDIR